MIMFYTSLINYAQSGASTTDATIKTFLKRRINSRYEIATSKLNTWTQSIQRTFTTGDSSAADQQFYANPPNLREIESIVLTKGAFDYPLTPVYAQEEWDRLNAQVITSASYPLKYFRRVNDYGIWPTPNEDDYTGTINYTRRATPLYFENYTTGTAAVTENSQTVTLTTGVTTTIKPGYWFTLADSNGEPRGTAYRILSITDSADFKLESFFEESTEATPKYIIGQAPEIPTEGHELLAIGAVADFYGLKQKDMASYTRFNNMFWTGAPNVTPLQARKDGDYGGLLALIDAYEDRDRSMIVSRVPVYRDLLDFATPRTITLPDG